MESPEPDESQRVAQCLSPPEMERTAADLESTIAGVRAAALVSIREFGGDIPPAAIPENEDQVRPVAGKNDF